MREHLRSVRPLGYTQRYLESSILLIELTKKRAKASRASLLSRFPITLTLVSSSTAHRSNESFFSTCPPPSLSFVSESVHAKIHVSFDFNSDERASPRSVEISHQEEPRCIPRIRQSTLIRIDVSRLTPRLLRSGQGKFVDRPLALTDSRSFFSVGASDRYLHSLVYRHLYRARAVLGARRSRKNRRTST